MSQLECKQGVWYLKPRRKNNQNHFILYVLYGVIHSSLMHFNKTGCSPLRNVEQLIYLKGGIRGLSGFTGNEDYIGWKEAA